jgi:hypothetical protein
VATGGLFLLTGGYVRAVRPRLARWGATADEVASAMPGDDEVPDPQPAATRAVTVGAPPEAMWPWLMQIGYHRAGWYAYDLFDNDDIPSAETILPEFQHLEIGQVLGEEGLTVRQIEPNRHLVLSFHYPKTTWGGEAGRLASLWPYLGVLAVEAIAGRPKDAPALPHAVLRPSRSKDLDGLLRASRFPVQPQDADRDQAPGRDAKLPSHRAVTASRLPELAHLRQ